MTLSSRAEALAALRTALLALNATGENGFEGLLAEVFGAASGQSFRLSSSGLQAGEDAASLGDTRVALEAKLYTGTVPRSEVLSKIADVAASNRPTELWALGATVAVGVQLRQALIDAAATFGLAVLIMDWPDDSTAPPLAAVCVQQAGTTAAFLRRALSDGALATQAEHALKRLEADPDLVPVAERIGAEVQGASDGLPFARRANAAWLSESFKEHRVARVRLGQPLTLLSPGPSGLKRRADLLSKMQDAISTPPPAPLAAVLGGEGCGKTWLLANAWRELPEPPVLLFVPAPEARRSVQDSAQLREFLVEKLIAQTDNDRSEGVVQRWRRRLRRWRAAPKPTRPRFLLCIDGLNQAASGGWPLWLDGAAIEVEGLGGLLVVTARTGFFRDHVAKSLGTRVRPITVGDWGPAELDAILTTCAVDASALSPEVKQTLANPRLLAVALNLLQEGHLDSLAGVTVGRLLFEHIRTSVADGVTADEQHVFAQKLAKHAEEILVRIRNQKHSDRLIFEPLPGATVADLQAVTGERFFQALPEDPNLYALTNDGLDLALGLAILRALQSAERNDRSVDDALGEILDPIAALDKTAAAMTAALSVAVVDERCSDVIRGVLNVAFLRLQNLDPDTGYAGFVATLRAAPTAALLAVEFLAASPAYTPYGGWLSAGVGELYEDPAHRVLVEGRIRNWLGGYSQNPDLGVFAPNDDAGRRKEQLELTSERLRKDWSALSARERAFFEEKMQRHDNLDPSALQKLALQLLVGHPLAPFAEALLAASLSQALNSSVDNAYDHLTDLIRFNTVDWPATKEALLAAAEHLKEGPSRLGLWARVHLLRAIATDEASNEEADLVEALTADREKFPGWRRVETLCATDPCDPTTVEPDNLAATADRYADINLAELDRGVGTTAEDLFLSEAGPGVARFRPEVAIDTHRRVVAEIMSREGRPLEVGLVTLRRDAALLVPEHIDALVELAKRHSRSVGPEGRHDEDWVISQFALLLAFSHLDGDRQLQVLTELPPHGPLLLEVFDMMRAAAATELAAYLTAALRTAETNRITAALGMICASSESPSQETLDVIRDLALGDDPDVRFQALAALAHLRPADGLARFAASGWSAGPVTERKDVEAWYGSLALIEAARAGVLPAEAVPDRIATNTYQRALDVLGEAVIEPIAARLKFAVDRTLGADLTAAHSPEQNVEISPGSHGLLSFQLTERTVDSEESRQRFGESEEIREARFQESWKRFREFRRALSEAGAALMLENPGAAVIAACVDCSAAWGVELAEHILTVEPERGYRVRNFGMLLSQALAPKYPELALRLFHHVGMMRNTLTLTSGVAKLPLDESVAWAADGGGDWNELRRSRLEEAHDDDDLAREVLAAVSAGRQVFIERYALECLSQEEPVRIARGLTVLGFGRSSAVAEAAFARFHDAKGYLGNAARSAKAAYDRLQWTAHWLGQMQTASDAATFWPASVLLRKIVDGRIDTLEPPAAASDFGLRFEILLSSEIKRRLGRWKTDRERKLFGHDTPKLP